MHIDYPPLFDNYMPLPPYCIYVHIPLVDLTEQNGPTEYWPGKRPSQTLVLTKKSPDRISSYGDSYNHQLHLPIRQAPLRNPPHWKTSGTLHIPILHPPSSRSPLTRIKKVKAGGAIIKDMRCFHRGTPNESEEIRPILSLIYARQWYRLPHGTNPKLGQQVALLIL